MRPIRKIKWASPEQKDLFEAGPDPILAIGGFNAAKTWGCVLKLLRLHDMFPNSRSAIIRRQAKHMRKTTMETFYTLCPPSAYSQGRRSDQDGICQLNNGSLIHFVHLDKPESIDILAGLELNFGFVDQAEQVIEKAWDTLDARLARWAQAIIPQWLLDKFPEGWPWVNEENEPTPPPYLFATANPPETEDHWLFTRFADESEERDHWRSEGYRMIRMTTDSNRYASKTNIRKMRSKGPAFVKRFVEGLWSSPEGTIFEISPLSILDPHPVLLKRIRDHMHLHRSLDHGDSSPTCVLWEATDHDDNIFFYREYYQANTLVSKHRQVVYDLSKADIPSYSEFLTPRYHSEIADPSIFAISRGRSAKSGPTWAVADEWTDTDILPEKTVVRWTPAPIPRTESETYELATRSRMKEYLAEDPDHRHPITGKLGAPHAYFIRQTESYPHGCFYVIKEIRGQRRKKTGEREGTPVYGEERQEGIPDHAYDTAKYHIISRPSPTRLVKRVDPNLINVRELMDWTASRARARARAVSMTGGY